MSVVRCVRLFVFFSSRRRHTRLQGDWSSDVCSSDLTEPAQPSGVHRPAALARFPLDRAVPERQLLEQAVGALLQARAPVIVAGGGVHISGASEALSAFADALKIGRASCRERV